ncbi:hypothetical protein J2TS4_56430 [Paenibacillus sp. J2TS4]|nr:hypothetical protein J2TS4_56430 [Paenibacillus sp. J2TS4]
MFLLALVTLPRQAKLTQVAPGRATLRQTNPGHAQAGLRYAKLTQVTPRLGYATPN